MGQVNQTLELVTTCVCFKQTWSKGERRQYQPTIFVSFSSPTDKQLKGDVADCTVFETKMCTK